MLEFFSLLAIAAVISFIPYIRTPLQTIVVFFHELSHGLAAIFTFGSLHRIQLNFNGSGHCVTAGGFRHIILLAGYAGASLFGYYIYYIGTQIQTNNAEIFLYSMLGLFAFVTLFWIRHIPSLILMAFMAALFYFPLKHELFEYTSLYLKFIGIYVCLSAVRSPLDLIDGKDVGDGAELFKITLLPEGFWILVWVCFGAFCLYNIYLLSVYQETLLKIL